MKGATAKSKQRRTLPKSKVQGPQAELPGKSVLAYTQPRIRISPAPNSSIWLLLVTRHP